MTKTLEFAYETPQEVKVGDDETTFTLVCKNEDLPVDLTTAKLITVKIGNRSGYLRGQLISIDSLAELPIGQFNFSFDKDTLDNFPTGNYCLEVWVTDAQGTSIYPSGNPLNFIVTTNIENSSGATITTITFDDFVEAMNKAASTIAKGDPGEGLDIKGQVTSVSELPTTANEGNGYLVNEELYVYASGVWKDCGTIQGPQGIQGKTGTGISSTTIQYQISNSATTSPTGTWSNSIVATTITNPYLWMKATLNYTDGTTKDFYLVSQKGDKGDKGDTGSVDNAGLTTAPVFVDLQTQVNNSAVGTNLLTGTSNAQDYTLSGAGWKRASQSSNGTNVSIPCTPGASYTYSVIIKSATFNCYPEIQFFDSGKNLIYTSTSVHGTDIGVRKTTGVAPENAAFIVSHMLLGDPSDSQTVVFNSEKLERGSVATDWCPNPSEILTQADYAKIQAAIIALGGSLK